MRTTAVALRYARALFEVAKKADAIDRIESDLGLIGHSLETMPRLAEALAHPLVPGERKKRIIAGVFSAAIDPVTLDFVCLLIDKRRSDVLAQMEGEYVNLANEYRGVTPALVTSAVPLSADERTALHAKLEVFTGKKVELTMEEDSTLIGGIMVRIGDTVIDGSVRGDLARLKDRLLGRTG
jgi:F-type H+-transporting ATPase subunit delta